MTTTELSNQCTELYALPLRKTAHGDPESLYSYVLHLAFQHRITITSFKMLYLCANALARTGKNLCVTCTKSSGVLMLGSTLPARQIVQMLEHGTGTKNLAHATMLPLGDFCSWNDLIAESNRVCLRCVRDDIEATNETFGRLLWKLRVVTCCPIHGDNLVAVDQCPTVAASSPKSALLRPVNMYGVCGGCASIGYQCQHLRGMGSEEERLTAVMCRDLLAAFPSLGGASPEAAKRAFRNFARTFERGYAAIANKAGVSRSLLHRWMNVEGASVQLRLIIDLAKVIGVSVADFLQGNLQNASPSRSLPVSRTPRPIRTLCLESISRDLIAALDSPDTNAADVGRKRNVCYKTLERANPKVFQALVRRHKSQRQTARVERWQMGADKAIAMLDRLRSLGWRLSLTNAANLDGQLWTPRETPGRVFRALLSADLDKYARYHWLPEEIIEKLRPMHEELKDYIAGQVGRPGRPKKDRTDQQQA